VYFLRRVADIVDCQYLEDGLRIEISPDGSCTDRSTEDVSGHAAYSVQEDSHEDLHLICLECGLAEDIGAVISHGYCLRCFTGVAMWLHTDRLTTDVERQAEIPLLMFYADTLERRGLLDKASELRDAADRLKAILTLKETGVPLWCVPPTTDGEIAQARVTRCGCRREAGDEENTLCQYCSATINNVYVFTPKKSPKKS